MSAEPDAAMAEDPIEELLCSGDEEMEEGAEPSETQQAGDAAEATAAARRVKRKGASEQAQGSSVDKHAADNQLDDAQTRLLRAMAAANRDTVKENLRPVKQAVSTLNKKVDAQGKKQQSDHAEAMKRISALENRGPGSAGSTMSGPSSRVDTMMGAARMLADSSFIPTKKRKVGIVGGFIYNETSLMVDFVKSELDKDALVYDKVVGSGSYGALVKIFFKCSDDMWKWLVKRKGKKYASELADESRPQSSDDPSKRNLWHGIDKYEWEIAASRKATSARSELAKVLMDKYKVENLTSVSCFESNDYNDVIMKTRNWAAAKNQYPIKIYELDRNTKELRVVVGCQAKMSSIGFEADIEGILATANLAGQRK